MQTQPQSVPMNELFDNLMTLCQTTDSFYYVDHVYDGTTYRVFSYRLASYTEFCLPGATECRGHTFAHVSYDDKQTMEWVLVSLPMQKFFNYSEHIGWGHLLDPQEIDFVMDKLDGSLISTVDGYATDSHPGLILKSKTSLTSQQAKDAWTWLSQPEQINYFQFVRHMVFCGYTINFEWISPNNQIVIPYSEQRLVVLNIRRHFENAEIGSYTPYREIKMLMHEYNVDTDKYLVKKYDIDNYEEFIKNAQHQKGIEGYVIVFKNGLWVKLKTDAYCTLHHVKDSVTNERRLWEACINEITDDLRAMFVDDPLCLERISKMEQKASTEFNKLHKMVYDFYETNKHLDRKSYAILGQQELNQYGVFSNAMNLYIGKPDNIKEYMIKNFKKFGINEITETE